MSSLLDLERRLEAELAALRAGLRWRVGRSIGRTIYLDGKIVAIAVGPDDEATAHAAAIVAAMNEREKR